MMNVAEAHVLLLLMPQTVASVVGSGGERQRCTQEGPSPGILRATVTLFSANTNPIRGHGGAN